MTEHCGLPPGWTQATLGELGEYINGRGFSKAEWSDTGRPIIRIQDLTGSGDAPNYFRGEVEAKYRVRPGDLLVSWAATLGAYIWRGPEGWLNQHIFRVQSYIDQGFHYYLIKSVLSDLYRQTHGSGMVHITRGRFDSTPVSLPPLAEQQRIVAAIEEQFTRLDAGVAALKRAQAALKRYRAAVLKAAVEGRLTAQWRAQHPDVRPASALLADILAERRVKWEADLRAKGKDPAKARYEEPKSPQTEGLPELPQGWVWATVDTCTASSLYGPRFASDLYSEQGVPVIRTTDIDGTGMIDSTAVPRVRISQEEIDKYQLQQNDLLVTRSGSIGRCAIFPSANEPCIAGAYLIQFRLVEPFVRPYYVLYFLLSPDGQRGLLSRMRAVTQANINAPAIRSIPIALPSLAEQEQIVAEVERRLSIINALENVVMANIKRTERLRQAILERAFTGRLVPQDPADEPASALQERIQLERGDERVVASRSTPKHSADVALQQRMEPEVASPRQTALWQD